MDQLDRALTRLDRRERIQAVIAAVATPLLVGLASAATAVVVVRLLLPEGAALAPACAVAGAALPLVAMVAPWRKRRPAAAVAGSLDRQLQADGLAMALSAQPAARRDPAWMDRLASAVHGFRPEPLAVRPLLPAALAALALAVAFALPQAAVMPRLSRPAPAVDRLEHRLADVVQAGMLNEEKKRALEERLKAVQQRVANNGMDQAAWEALDRLNADLDRSADDAGRRLAAAIVAADGAALGDAALVAALPAALAELAQHPGLVPKLPAGAAGAALQAALAAAARQAAEAGHLSPAQAAALAQAGLAPAREGAGKADPAAAKRLAEHLKGELAKGQGACAACGGAAALAGELGRLGNGGVNRGPGHAPLTKGDPLRTPGGYTDSLAPGQRENEDGSLTLAETARDPEAAKAAVAARASLTDHGSAAADARSAHVAPRHRAVVEAYFPGQKP
ncbi:hypothetical protein LBMAG53_11540 [Planctomycetota bacterium]|nr:hypothetical protein LBMAG53_11540 [Planctomycetota bacterium]